MGGCNGFQVVLGGFEGGFRWFWGGFRWFWVVQRRVIRWFWVVLRWVLGGSGFWGNKNQTKVYLCDNTLKYECMYCHWKCERWTQKAKKEPEWIEEQWHCAGDVRVLYSMCVFSLLSENVCKQLRKTHGLSETLKAVEAIGKIPPELNCTFQSVLGEQNVKGQFYLRKSQLATSGDEVFHIQSTLCGAELWLQTSRTFIDWLVASAVLLVVSLLEVSVHRSLHHCHQLSHSVTPVCSSSTCPSFSTCIEDILSSKRQLMRL